MVFWKFAGGKTVGKITKIVNTGKVKIPNSSISMVASLEQPIALIRVYKNGVETKAVVGHKLSTLQRLKIN
jgi:hypothetical protein